MKTTTNTAEIFAFILGLAFVASATVWADTQYEKGDAGHLKDSAEVLDCKKDKWVGTHHSESHDCDLICFYWPGGPFTVEVDSIPANSMDVGLMVFLEDGTCYATENDHEGGGRESLYIPDLPKGKCYLYAGYSRVRGYHNYTDLIYDSNAYCSTSTQSPVAGPLYGCRVIYPPIGGSYEVYFPGYEHIGIPFQPDATCGPSSSKAEQKGDGQYNITGAGQQLKQKVSGIKGKCYFQCKNESPTRGATGIRVSGASSKKYKQSYQDATSNENLTAQLKLGDYCKNYDPGAHQTILCKVKPKGKEKKKSNPKGTIRFVCESGAGERVDTSVCKFLFKRGK